MTSEQPDEPTAGTRMAGSATEVRSAIIGGLVIICLSAGWFALSHLVMGTAVGDALGEALGVGSALLVVASIIGAVVAGRRNHP